MTQDDRQKVEAYLGVIEDHVINVICHTTLRENCIATLMLVFAAVDGLGRLTHEDERAKPGQRFRSFIATFGPDYSERAERLWTLRNSLTHNGLNVAAYLSKTQRGQEHHLCEVGAPGDIYVNTRRLFEDFYTAFRRIRCELLSDPARMRCAASRLRWNHDRHPRSYPTTPPPVIDFVDVRYVQNRDEPSSSGAEDAAD